MARPVTAADEIITAFRDGQVCLRSKRRTEGYTFAEKEVGYQRILKGDLVIHTMDAFAGAIGVSEDDGKATGEYAVCKPRSDEAVPEYYAYLLRCMARRNYIYVLCPSVRERAPRFRFVRFAPVKLPVPPRAEQLEIVERIERVTARLKNLISTTERSIDLLREKRAALITAAVTGKIDVRAAA
jgi:type I restriction enzyme, S subunit